MKSIADIPLTIKKIISEDNEESKKLLLASDDLNDEVRNILLCNLLTAENIFLTHGKELALMYIQICNEADSIELDKELKEYLVNR